MRESSRLRLVDLFEDLKPLSRLAFAGFPIVGGAAAAEARDGLARFERTGGGGFEA
jgi:hypothetical protein